MQVSAVSRDPDNLVYKFGEFGQLGIPETADIVTAGKIRLVVYHKNLLFFQKRRFVHQKIQQMFQVLIFLLANNDPFAIWQVYLPFRQPFFPIL